jgi:hypothetical protein
MKYERHTTGPEFDSTWYYDTEINGLNPISVVHKWHNNFKTIQQEEKQNKLDKKEQKRTNNFFKFKEQQNETTKTVSKSNKQQGKHVSGRGRKRKV